MAAFLLRRIIYLVPTFFGATLLAFVIIQLSPGDFLTQRALDPNITQESLQRLQQQFGLDKPLYIQYILWMENLFRFNLGYSFSYQQPVLQIIQAPVSNSLILVITSTILLYIIAIPIGVYGAVNQYSTGDRIVSFLAYVGLAIPSFFFALIAIYFILQFKFRFGFELLPVGGMTSSGFENFSTWDKIRDVGWHLIAPALIAVSNDIAGFTRFLRGQMLDNLNQDYVRTARSKGLNERLVIYKHALRNAAIPFIAGIGGILPALIAGAGFVEVVMRWPGITPFFLDALGNQDLFVLTGLLVMSLVLLMIGNVLSDLLLALVDPRIRYY